MSVVKDVTLCVKEVFTIEIQKVEKETITEGIIRQIVSLLNDGVFQPGDKLPSEKELMQKMEVGRSSVREGLHILVALNILESKAGKGYYVKNPSNIFDNVARSDIIKFALEQGEFLDLLEAREVLEKRITILAIQRATEDDIKEMDKILEDIKEAMEKGRKLTELTANVHLAFAKATHNQILVQMMKLILPLIISKAKGMEIPPEKDLKMHSELIYCLKDRNVEQMRKLIDNHLSYIRDKYVDHLKVENKTGMEVI